MHLEKIDDYRWLIPRTYKAGMRTDTMIFANEQLLEAIRRDQSLEQAANVAMLPGIVGRALAMPDIHQGYGFPIGGVAAVDEEHGVVSPPALAAGASCASERAEGSRAIIPGLRVRARLRSAPCKGAQAAERALSGRG